MADHERSGEVRPNPGSVPAGSDRKEPVFPGDAAPSTASRQLAASFQLNVANALRTRCPHCNKPTDGDGLLLNLTIGPVDEGVHVLLVRSGASLTVAVDDLRRALITDALTRTNRNQAKAAKLLGVKYTTFHALARRLGLVKRNPELDAVLPADELDAALSEDELDAALPADEFDAALPEDELE